MSADKKPYGEIELPGEIATAFMTGRPEFVKIYVVQKEQEGETEKANLAKAIHDLLLQKIEVQERVSRFENQIEGKLTEHAKALTRLGNEISVGVDELFDMMDGEQ